MKKVKVRLSPDEENFRHRRRKPSDRNEAVDTYGDLRKSKVYLKYMPKLLHQADGENFESEPLNKVR